MVLSLHMSTSAYPGSSSSGPYASSQLGIHSRHPSILAASCEQDIRGYRSHPNASGPYGGQYSSLYGAASLSSGQQVSVLTAKGTQSTAVEVRGAYGSLRVNLPRYASAEYVPSTSHGYTLKTDRFLAEKIPDYASIDKVQMGRDLPSDAMERYSDSVGYAHHQPGIHDRIDQAVLREQMLKSQSMHLLPMIVLSAALICRSMIVLFTLNSKTFLADKLIILQQELVIYVIHLKRGSTSINSTTGRSSYNTQHTPILGAAPLRNMDNLLYSQGSTNPGYGVSLPPLAGTMV